MDTKERKHPKRFRFGVALVAIVATVFLFGWFFYLEKRDEGAGSFREIVSSVPATENIRENLGSVDSILSLVFSGDGEPATYLLLFQNNLELRPGGGFIGSFGIMKVRGGKIEDLTVHDTGVFDTLIPDTVEPPYPLRELSGVDAWKLRDSNWSPDFPTNARQAAGFYRMGGGTEDLDGVIGITADVLASLLSVTGPVSVPGFPGEYDARDGVFELEYQVEQGYREQGIDFSERKSVLGELGEAVLAKVGNLPPRDWLRLFDVAGKSLARKDVQIVLFDDRIAGMADFSGWDGGFDTDFSGDFFMAVDANVDAWKTDAVMERSFAYEADFSGEVPKARLTVSYRHVGTERNFMIKDYQSFLRVYVPDGSWFQSVAGGDSDPVFGDFMGRKYVGTVVRVPLGGTKEVVFEYDLPEGVTRNGYDLKVVRQPGTKDIPLRVTVIGEDGSRVVREAVLDRDFVFGDAAE